MAHVTLDDGRELDVDDSDTGLLDYYRGINAKVEADTVLQPPYTIDEHGNVVETVVPEVAAVDPGEQGPAEVPPAGDNPPVPPLDDPGPVPDESSGKRR